MLKWRLMLAGEDRWIQYMLWKSFFHTSCTGIFNERQVKVAVSFSQTVSKTKRQYEQLHCLLSCKPEDFSVDFMAFPLRNCSETEDSWATDERDRKESEREGERALYLSLNWIKDLAGIICSNVCRVKRCSEASLTQRALILKPNKVHSATLNTISTGWAVSF